MTFRRSTILCMIVFTAMVALLPKAQAASDHCSRATIPASVASVLKAEAPGVSVPKSWATNRDLAFLLCHESGFDWCAVNPGRHACGYTGRTNSCGLFQRLPCERHVFASRPLQARNGLAYIRDRYHHPAAARAHWRTHHWY